MGFESQVNSVTVPSKVIRNNAIVFPGAAIEGVSVSVKCCQGPGSPQTTRVNKSVNRAAALTLFMPSCLLPFDSEGLSLQQLSELFSELFSELI